MFGSLGPTLWYIDALYYSGIPALREWHPFLIINAHPQDATGTEVPLIHAMLFLWGMMLLLFLAERILFVVTAYQDAKAGCPKRAPMWAALIGVLGLVPGVVYLILRKKVYVQKMACADCSHTVKAVMAPRPNVRKLLRLLVISCIVFVAFLMIYNYLANISSNLFDVNSAPAWMLNFPF